MKIKGKNLWSCLYNQEHKIKKVFYLVNLFQLKKASLSLISTNILLKRMFIWNLNSDFFLEKKDLLNNAHYIRFELAKSDQT